MDATRFVTDRVKRRPFGRPVYRRGVAGRPLNPRRLARIPVDRASRSQLDLGTKRVARSQHNEPLT